MKKKILRQVLAMCFCLLLFLSTLTVYAEETIKHSTVDYDASFENATQIYIGNEKAVEWKVGAKYFLHYTVVDVTENHTNQSGMLITKNRTLDFPYLEGGMHYGEHVSICEEGWTYLFRFEVTESGFKYVAGKANVTESSYIQFPQTMGEVKTDAPYFGVWISGTNGESLTADFRHIRCYDEKGNDLGVYAPKAKKIETSDMNTIDVPHSYSFSVKDVGCFAFGNARHTESDVILLEYTVNNVKAKNVTQSGAEFTNAPTEYYPHADRGYLNYDAHSDDNPSKLLTEGANYLVRFERGKESFNVLVRRTMPNGAVDYFSFAEFHGTYNEKYGYVVMWIGEECRLTADFSNVKCYDDKGNNLAIQTNKDVDVAHYGDLEDYTPCAAMYYCEKNNTLFTLSRECDASISVDGETGETKGVYSIRNGVLTLKVEDDTEEYTYAYEYIKDKDGNKYVRLRDAKVTFVSKQIDGEVLSVVEANAANAYRIAKPENPKDENSKFIEWVDGTGHRYDFDKHVTESLTLYATWDAEQKWESIPASGESGTQTDVLISGVICSLLVLGTATAIVVFVKRRRRIETER